MNIYLMKKKTQQEEGAYKLSQEDYQKHYTKFGGVSQVETTKVVVGDKLQINLNNFYFTKMHRTYG